MFPTLTIIIPCYNSGEYLAEALKSIECYKGDYSYDIIIINDGSTDEATMLLLRELEDKKVKVIHQQNKGPAGARNTGVVNSKSDFLLFLDSDNKILPDYIDKSLSYLITNSSFGVVYSRPNFFGDSNVPRFHTGPFDLNRLLFGNFIDMCAVVRRKAWDEVNGLDEDRSLIGYEDWDFWIRVSLAGWQFHYIDEALFDYRICNHSLVMSVINTNKEKKVFSYVFKKHVDLYVENFRYLSIQYAIYRDDQRQPLRSFFKFFVNKYFK